MAARTSLTVYGIKKAIRGVDVKDFKDPLRPDLRGSLGTPDSPLVEYELRPDLGFDGRLFVQTVEPRQPAWFQFLAPGIVGLELLASPSQSAVLVLRIKHSGADHFFALTFGFGRYLLDSDGYQRNYGLKVALNAIYESGEDLSRIQRVDMKTVDANTMRTRRQSNRQATFDAFGVDLRRDLLSAVTGKPVITETWGSRITGADAIRLNAIGELRQAGDLCKGILDMANADHYVERFGWIDKVTTVTDAEAIARLEKEVLATLAEIAEMAPEQRGSAPFDLAPSELVDWDAVDKFSFSVASEERHDDLRIGDYLDALDASGQLASLDIASLRTKHRVHAWDDNGDEINHWTLFSCLDGQITLDGQTFLLVEGEFFQVADDYLSELDLFVDGIAEWPNSLPPADGDPTEGVYNQLAANSSDHYLLLDKQTVRVPEATSDIEICDILTSNREFVHVKRKLRSSALSHLFGQGAVSGELLLRSRAFRERSLARIQEAEKLRAEDTKDDGFLHRFSTFSAEGILPSQFEVVYAIVADWGDRPYSQALPFFSKVNLRRHVEDLQSLGYRVSLKSVPTS